MNHQDLLDQIEGHLKLKHYLEAFLTQSAYIESLLRIKQDLQILSELGKTGFRALNNKPYLSEISKELDKVSISKIISRLSKASEITGDETKILFGYFDERNKIIHGLTRKMKRADFNEQLRSICEAGQKITKFKVLKGSAGFLDYFDTIPVKKVSRVKKV